MAIRYNTRWLQVHWFAEMVLLCSNSATKKRVVKTQNRVKHQV